MFMKFLVCYKSNQTDCDTESNPKLKSSLGSGTRYHCISLVNQLWQNTCSHTFNILQNTRALAIFWRNPHGHSASYLSICPLEDLLSYPLSSSFNY